jgi:serine/threonine-protein kinase RsbW
MSAPARTQPEPDPQDEPARLRVRVAACLDAISPAVERVMTIVQAMGCAAGKEFEVETALREALSNAIRHGCAGDVTKRVEIVVGCNDANEVVIVVRDPGPGFDPSLVPSPTVGTNVYRHHGRGIYLINQLMDEVSFRRNGSEIRMRKR